MQDKGRGKVRKEKMATVRARASMKLPQEVNRILFVRNLPYKITPEEMYDLFGKFGPIRQIRLFVGFHTPHFFLLVQHLSRYVCAACSPPQYFLTLTLCRGTAQDTRGTAFVVYEDIFDAKNAVEHLSGFNVGNRYLVVMYHQQSRMLKRLDTEKKREELERLKRTHNLDTSDAPAAAAQ